MFEGIPRTARAANPIFINSAISIPGSSRTETDRQWWLSRWRDAANTLPPASALVSPLTTAMGEVFEPGRVAARLLAAFDSGDMRRAGMNQTRA